MSVCWRWKVKTHHEQSCFSCFHPPSSLHSEGSNIDFSELNQLVGLLSSSVTSAAVRSGAHITHGR